MIRIEREVRLRYVAEVSRDEAIEYLGNSDDYDGDPSTLADAKLAEALAETANKDFALDDELTDLSCEVDSGNDDWEVA